MADRRKKVETRTFDEPDETFRDDTGSAGRIVVGGLSIWRVVFEPGWRYTEHADGELCPAPHAAYIESGRLHVLTDDGTEAEGGPGAVMVIEPGHDAWTVGGEPCVFIDFGESVRSADGR
jgi:quercetin dioxygenase-like cupin family protein